MNCSDVAAVGVACCRDAVGSGGGGGGTIVLVASDLSAPVLLGVMVLDSFLRGMLNSLIIGDVIPFPPDPPLELPFGLTEDDLLLGVTNPPVVVDNEL